MGELRQGYRYNSKSFSNYSSLSPDILSTAEGGRGWGEVIADLSFQILFLMNDSDKKISSDRSSSIAGQGAGPLSSTERIKMASDALRGTFVESLANEITGSIYEDDYALVRFHGMYVQDDRDRREERAAKKLERLYSFMIRLRLTGGVITPEQYITLHNVAGENSLPGKPYNCMAF